MLMTRIYVEPEFAARLLRIKDSVQRREIARILKEVSHDPSILKPLKSIDRYTLLEAKPRHSLPYRLYFIYDSERDEYIAVSWESKDVQEREIQRLYREMKRLFSGV